MKLKSLGILLLCFTFLIRCGNDTGETNNTKTLSKADSLELVKQEVLRKEVSGRALLDRIADFQLLCAVQQKGKFGIYLINGDGTGLEELTDDKGNDLFPRWLRDATGFVFETDRNQKFQTYLFSLEDSLYKRISRNSFNERSPNPSLENEIVFIGDRDGAKHLYRMDLKGNNLQKITETAYNDAYPVWSPDALSLTFHTFRHDNHADIYVTDRSGGNPIRITTDEGLDMMPDWSPDGKELVFVSNRTGNFDIYRTKADGKGKLENLTNTPNINESMPTWSPDGNFIAYSVSGNSKNSIYVMTKNGTTSTQITPDGVAASMPSWRPPTELERALEAEKPTANKTIEIQTK